MANGLKALRSGRVKMTMGCENCGCLRYSQCTCQRGTKAEAREAAKKAAEAKVAEAAEATA